MKVITHAFLLMAAACVANVVSISDTLAAQQIGPVPITRIRTGWSSDQFAIETGQPISNPANCASPDGYISNSTNPGHKTHYAATLTAFSLGKSVTIVISDTECISGRPIILGIHMAQ